MKRFILIAILFCVGLIAQAQTVGGFSAFVVDTTTNVETEYLVLASPVAVLGNYTGAIYVTGDTLSGSATVTAAIQVSNNGTVWYNYGTAITINNAGTCSNYSWTLQETAHRYYRVRLISSGTGVTRFTGGIALKRKQ